MEWVMRATASSGLDGLRSRSEGGWGAGGRVWREGPPRGQRRTSPAADPVSVQPQTMQVLPSMPEAQCGPGGIQSPWRRKMHSDVVEAPERHRATHLKTTGSLATQIWSSTTKGRWKMPTEAAQSICMA